MKSVSIRELRELLSDLDKVLARDGEVMVTRHGHPIARIVPAAKRRTMPSHRDFLAKQPMQATGSEVGIRQERDERG